jgi:hypothetical protein
MANNEVFMKVYHAMIILLGIFFVNNIFAGMTATAPANVPTNDFIYKGKIIHPFCLEQLGIADMQDGPIDGKTINLGTCATRSCRATPGAKSNDMVACYHDADAGFTGYKINCKYGDDIYVLSTYYNGGGSGTFEEVLIAKKDKKYLTLLRHIDGRVMCGIKDVNITQNDMLLVRKYRGEGIPGQGCDETKIDTFTIDLKSLVKK